MSVKLGNIPEEDTNFDFEQIPEYIKLSGVTFEGRQSILPQLKENSMVELVRDSKNPYDRNAIKVVTEFNNREVQIGWIPRDWAAVLAPEMDAGIYWTGKIGKVIGGQDQNKGVLVRLSIKN
jgi:hypothetical protein